MVRVLNVIRIGLMVLNCMLAIVGFAFLLALQLFQL
jgi:hypothetical protein